MLCMDIIREVSGTGQDQNTLKMAANSDNQQAASSEPAVMRYIPTNLQL